MLRWLAKTLWMQRLSLLASSGGVAAAFLLVVMLDAVFVGESTRIVAYLERTGADVWVMQRGVTNMHMANSFVWDWKTKRIAALPGVKRATPILYVNTVVKAGGRNWYSFVVGLLPDAQRAGPWAMAEGRAMPGAGEIVVPRLFAQMTGIGLGGEASIADKRFRVVGLSEGTFSMANSIAFVTFIDLEDLLSTSGTVSYVLVDAEPGQDAGKLAARIEQEVEKVTARTREQFVRNDFAIAVQMGVEIIAFMTVIGAALAGLIVAFTAYSQVVQRQRELAIAKALGVRNRAVYLTAAAQAMIITALGFVIASAGAWALPPVISALVPQITLVVTVEALSRTAILALAVAVVSALIPGHLVARVDPASVFKA